MWLWIFSTLLGTAPLMGVTLQLARVSPIPLILLFAPAVLLGPNLGAETAMRGVYYLMPVQCIIYGLILAQSELSGKRWGTLMGLGLAHGVIALRAWAVTGGQLPG